MECVITEHSKYKKPLFNSKFEMISGAYFVLFFLSLHIPGREFLCAITQGTNSEVEQFSALLFCNTSLLLSLSGAPIDKIYSLCGR